MIRHIGLLSAILTAADTGTLTGLNRFTPDEVAQKLEQFLSVPPSPRQLSQSLWYAKRKGFLATQERDGTLSVTLTYKGREHLSALRRLSVAIEKPQAWDGKWRMVTFDIPERRRYARDTFRVALKRIGFQKLEASLWVFPHECREELDLIAEDLLVKPHVRYFLVESFDGDKELEKAFGLSRNQQSTTNNQQGQ